MAALRIHGPRFLLACCFTSHGVFSCPHAPRCPHHITSQLEGKEKGKSLWFFFLKFSLEVNIPHIFVHISLARTSYKVLAIPNQKGDWEMHADQEATVRTLYGTTDLFKVKKGVRQGCLLSLCLCNLYAGQEETVRTGHGTTDWFQTGKGDRKSTRLNSSHNA